MYCSAVTTLPIGHFRSSRHSNHLRSLAATALMESSRSLNLLTSLVSLPY